jgi:hypothetical protein
VSNAEDNPSNPDNNSFLGNAHPTTMFGLFKRTYLIREQPMKTSKIQQGFSESLELEAMPGK